MSKPINSSLSEAVPFQMPFHRKQNVVLTRLLNRAHIQQGIRKTITIPHSDRLIFEEVLAQLREFVRVQEGTESLLRIKGVEIGREEQEDALSYDITRSYINCNTLKQCLLEEKPELAPTPLLLNALLSAYLRTIHLNHILCSSANLYFSPQQSWSKRPSFEFNFTSVGFLFDSYRRRPLCRADLVECANYLPPFFYQEEVGKRFSFSLKLRSLAVNLLGIVLQRDIDFARSFPNGEFYDQQQISQILAKVNSCFQEFLKNSKIKQQIQRISATIGVDLMTFLRVVLLQRNTAEFEQFDSWTKIIRYFNFPFIVAYKPFFLLELSPSSTFSRNYLESWLLKKWGEENEYIKDRMRAVGLMGGDSVEDLILYVLYRFNLISQPHFSEGNEAYYPKFLKRLTIFYAEIIDSDFLLEPVPENNLSKAKLDRNDGLFRVVKVLGQHLQELSIRTSAKDTLLYVSKEDIDLKTIYERCWHFRKN